jgi:hypothetical protein
MSNAESYDRFMEALDVVNRVLEANRGEGAYGTVLEAIDEHLEGHTATVEVYDDDPHAPFDAFTVRWTDGRFELRERGKGEHDSTWKVSARYLDSLIENPETYVQHPTRLDLDWLTERLPDEVRSLTG